MSIKELSNKGFLMKKLYAIAWLIVCGLTFTSCQSETSCKPDATATRNPEQTKGNVVYLHHIVTKNDNAQSQFNSVLKENQLVLVDYYASWCRPCKRMSPAIDTVAKQFPNVVFLKVDVDQFSNVATGIKSIPVLRLFKNGKQVYSQPGEKSQSKITSLIEKYA